MRAVRPGGEPGVAAAVLALLAAGSVAMIGVTSFTPFDPPEWLRIATMAPLPFALAGSVACALAGLRPCARRAWAIAGLGLDGVSVLALLAMLNVGG